MMTLRELIKELEEIRHDGGNLQGGRSTRPVHICGFRGYGTDGYSGAEVKSAVVNATTGGVMLLFDDMPAPDPTDKLRSRGGI